jgi:ABC-type uncharacterized transport system involved in gliding motility auxiliary subunit
VLGVFLYIFSPGTEYLIILFLMTGFIILILSLIFSYRSTRSSGYRLAAKRKTETYITSALVLAVLILIQAVAIRNDRRIDTTVNRRFSLSGKTIDVLDQLDTDIRIIGFYSDSDTGKNAIEDLLESYSASSGRVEYEFVNPDRDPATARRYGVEEFGTAVVVTEEGSEKLTGLNESKLTNSIYRFVSRKRLKIYFMTGHGERSIDSDENIGFSSLAELLRSENFSVSELTLGSGTGIPSDCNILVVAGPERDILPFERETISSYLQGQGRALFLIDPLIDCPQISQVLSPYGMVPENSIIVDRSGMLTSGNYLTPVVNRYGEHIITRGFTYFSFFPQARSLRLENVAGEISVTGLCFTNKNAYSETDLELVMEGRTRFDGGRDREGPVPLAAVSSASGEGDSPSETRVALFGDSDFASNRILELYGNRDLIMNTVNWLARRENLITIRPDSRIVQPVLLTMREGRLVYWLSIAILPGLVIVTGLVVQARKRKRSEGPR